MGTVNHADASLVITVDSGREVDGREGTDFNCEAEDLVRKDPGGARVCYRAATLKYLASANDQDVF